jgi:hypothetical protein
MIYQYSCGEHITEKMRKIADRHQPVECECGKPSKLIISRPSGSPDGIYSFAPNMGDPNVFDRRHEMLKQNKRLGDGSGV